MKHDRSARQHASRRTRQLAAVGVGVTLALATTGTARSAGARVAYCLDGKFLNLEYNQPDTDLAYKGATLARYVKLVGLTCRPAPAGWVTKTTAADELGVPGGLYAYWAPSTNLVQTAAATGSLTTFVSLLGRAGLAEMLGSGRFTVFAPTDAAFAKLPIETRAALESNSGLLRATLLSWVVRGEVTTHELSTLEAVKTLNGSLLRVRATGSSIVVDGAKLENGDIAASNGIVHPVDTVVISWSL